ncbi:MAG: ankyrin repeat domain-containing protein [Acidobacteria bacterium]|nr:ankyrin repeat domain-containing protein [Acidobacteriota bacterium]
MGVKIKGLAGWWMAALLSVSSLAASGDLRLVEAVQKGNKEAVRILLQQADVNAPQADGATALHWAAHRDDLETAELLIRAGANLNAANFYGVTALSLACTNRSAAMVEKLLEAGTNPSAAQLTGETALMTCARTGNLDAVKSLLAHGADVNATESKKGQTALMWALAGKHSEVARALIEHGADIHARSKSILMPETYYRNRDFGAGGSDSYSAITPYRESKGGFTPLLFAAQQGDLQSARILLEAGADVNEATPRDGNALVVASASGHEELSIFLLEKGADPNAADSNGITALHAAVLRGLSALTKVRYDSSYRRRPPNMPKLAKALLAMGANPNARIKKPEHRGPGDSSEIQFTMVGATPFLLAAVAADAELMRLLVASGADPRLTAGSKTTPLMAAAGAVCEQTCAFQSENLGNEEQERKALEAVRAAVETGADLHAINEDGQTAMHAAAFVGADSIVQFLADNGAEVDLKDKFGETPWSMASGISSVMRRRGHYGSHESTANLLLKLGATKVSREELDPDAPLPTGL